MVSLTEQDKKNAELIFGEKKTDNLTDRDKINANLVFNTDKEEEVLSEQDKKNANIIFGWNDEKDTGWSIDDIVNSLEWTKAWAFMSKDWFNTTGKKIWNWFGNARHSIIDKDNKRWIYDYSQYKEYKKAMEAAENSWEEVDRDAVYKSMAEEGIIDYNKFVSTIDDEYVDQYADFKKQLEKNKENFSNELKNKLSPYMQKASTDSYKINNLTKAIEKMTNQRQMFVDDIMETYKETRDPKLIAYIKTVLDDYDNSIETFTSEWAKSLVYENRTAWWAYYDVLNDYWMRDLANTIQRIQYNAKNKMSRAAVIDNFRDSWQWFEHWNFIQWFGELVWWVLNSLDFVLNQVWAWLEEAKQAVGWMYDVVEELNHLNAYADDANWFKKAFGSLGSWTMSIIDSLDSWWPAVVDLLVWEKIGTVSKAAKAIKYVDKIADAADTTKKAAWFSKVIQKWKFKNLVKVWETKWKQYLSEVLKDIFIYDVAFQQFEGHPLTTDEMTLNVAMNLPLDYMAVALRQWAKYFKPDMAADILKHDEISLELVKKLEEWIKKWYSEKKLAEIYYIGKSLETNNPPKNLVKISEWIETDKKDLYEAIKKIQENSLWVRDRLTKFQWDMDDLIAEMESRVSRKTRNKGSLGEQMDEYVQRLFNTSNMTKIFSDNIRIRWNIAFIWDLIDKEVIGAWDAAALKKAVFDAAWDNKQVAQVLYAMWLSDEKWLIEWLVQGKLDWWDVDRILQDTIKNLYKWNNKIIDYWDFINWFIKSQNADWQTVWKNVFTGKEIIPGWRDMTKAQIDEQVMNEIFQWQDFKVHTIELNNLTEIALLRKPDENWFIEISDIFKNTYTLNPTRYAAIQWTPTGKMVDKVFNDVWLKIKKDAQWNISIKATEDKLRALQEASSNMRWKDWLAKWDSDNFSAFKIMFLDDYINSFNWYVDTLRANKNITQTELDNAVKNYKSWIEKIEDPSSRELRDNTNKVLKTDSKKSTKIIPNKNIWKRQQEIISETVVKASNWLIWYTDAEAEIANQLWQWTAINVKRAKDWAIDEAWLKQQLIELMDDVVSPSRQSMEEATNVKNFEWQTAQLKYQMIDDSQKAKNLLADKMIDFLRQFNYDVEAYQEMADVAGKFLWIISQSPLALKWLAESDNTMQFMSTIFSRMLTDNEVALTNYLMRWQEVYRWLLWGNEDFKAFKSMWIEIENAITLAKQNKIKWAKRADVINTLNKIQWTYNKADYDEWKKIVSKWFDRLNKKVEKLWKTINLSTAKPEEIELLWDFLARQQMRKTGFYSAEVYKKLKEWFTDWLRQNIWTVRIIDDWWFSYEVWWDVKLWVYMTNVLLWNLDDADLLAKVTIWHEFEHKALIWDSRHKNIYIWQLTDNAKINKARIKIQEKEFESIWWYVKSYVTDLKEWFRSMMLNAKPWKLNSLYNTAWVLDDPQAFDELLNSLSEEEVIARLWEIAKKILSEKDASYLTKANMINEALLSIPLFSALDETITELTSMYRMTWYGYKGFNVEKMNEVFEKAEHTAELIDRFRNMFFDSSMKNPQDFIDALRVSYNTNDIKYVPKAKELITQKILRWMLFNWEIPSKEVIVTPNSIVNDLWSRWTNEIKEEDLFNWKIDLPKWKKLVFFDLETTGVKKNVLEWEEHPEVIQMAYKVVSNEWEWNKANVVSRYYNVSPKWDEEYRLMYENKVRLAKENKEKDVWLISPKEYHKRLDNQKWENRFFKDSDEFKELQKLAKDDDVIFVFHNWLQFDLPIVNRLGAWIPETKCVDTLQLHKALNPFSWVWRQEEMVKADKWFKTIADALDKFTKETWKVLEQHNAETDTQQLWYIFWHLYNHLYKNWKIPEGASADDIVNEMKKISMQMQRTKKWEYVKTDWSKDIYAIDLSKWWVEWLSEMVSKAIKLGDIDTNKPVKFIKEDIIKSLTDYKNKIAATNMRNIININELDDMIKTLRWMDSSEVVTFAQMVDWLHHYEPKIKDIKKGADKSYTPSVVDNIETEYFDYVDYGSVDWEVFWLTKKVKDEKIVDETITKNKRVSKTINDKLISAHKTDTVDVVETLQTLKWTLGENWDQLLNSLINHVKWKWLQIDANKLLVWEKTVAAYNRLVKKWYKWDFNMFCLNRIYNNVLDLDESLKTEDFITKVNINFWDRYDAIRNKLARWRVISWDNITNKDISVLSDYIDAVLETLDNQVYWLQLDKDTILKNYPVEWIWEFNRLVVKYMDAIKKWNTKYAETTEKEIIDSLLSNINFGVKEFKKDKDILNTSKVAWKNFSLHWMIRTINNKLWQPVSDKKILNIINAKTLEEYQWEYQMLMMRILDWDKEASKTAKGFLTRMYRNILYDIATKRILKDDKAQTEALRLFYADDDTLFKTFHKKDVKVWGDMKAAAEERMYRDDLLWKVEYDAKEYLDEYWDVMDQENISEWVQSEVYKRVRRSDEDILNTFRTKYKMKIDSSIKKVDDFYAKLEETEKWRKKLEELRSKVKDGDFYTYEFNKELDFGLLWRLDDMLERMSSKYDIKLWDYYKVTEIWPDDTSRALTTNQWIFFKQANLEDNEIEELFKWTDIDEGKAISKFQWYNNWMYSNSILENINRWWLQDGQIANVTFGNWIEFKIDKYWIVKDENTDEFELLFSAINSLSKLWLDKEWKIQRLRWEWATVSLYTSKFVSAPEKVYYRNFWNSIVWKALAKEFWIDNTISTSKIINAEWETYDELLTTIRANWLNENIEWPWVLAAIYDKMLQREETYIKSVEITDEESKQLAESFAEEKAKHRDIVQKIKRTIEWQLEWTMYDVWRKDFISDIERFGSLKINPVVLDPEAQLVRIVDEKWKIIEEINSSTEYFPLYRLEDDWTIKLDSEYPSKIKESKREKKYNLEWKKEDKQLFNHWNRWSRAVTVRKQDWKYVIISETPMKDTDMWLSVYKVKLNYVRKEYPYQDKLWDPISETYKEADEEVWFVEWKYQELSDLLLEREWIDPWYWRWTFEEKRWLTEAYEDLEPYYWDNYDVIFRDNNWNLYYGSISKTKTMNKDGIMYNSYNIKVDNSSHLNENRIKPRKNQDKITYDVIREVERRLDEINNSRKSVWKSKSDLIKKEIRDRINSMSREEFIEYYNKKYAKKEWLNRKLTDKESEALWEEVSKLKKEYGKVVKGEDDYIRKELEKASEPWEFETTMSFNAVDWWWRLNPVHKELEADEWWAAILWWYYRYDYDENGKLTKEWIDSNTIFRWKRVNWLDQDWKEYEKILKKQKQWRYKDMSRRFKNWDRTYTRFQTGDWLGAEKDTISKNIEYARKNKNEAGVRKWMSAEKDLERTKAILEEWSWETPTTVSNNLSAVWRQVAWLTNKTLIRDDKTIRNIVWERDTFLQVKWKQLDNLVQKWNDLVNKRTDEELDKIFDAYKRQRDITIRNNDTDGRIILIDIQDIDKEADELINEFAKIMNFDGSWKNISIMKMFNKPKDLFDIVAKMKNSNLIAAMWKMNWSKQDVFEYVVRSGKTLGITDPKRLTNMAQDFVWDPLWVGNFTNALANLRSINRFFKYSVPAPISWTAMLLNGTLLWEQMYRAKKKWLSWLMDNEIFEKIVLNENLMRVFNRWEDIVLHWNTDMDVWTIAFDRWLKNLADAFTKEWTKARELAETVLLWGIHSIQDLTYNAKVRVLAFAQALQQKWITELQLEDILAKIESWEMFSNPAYKQAWNDIMAMTEYYYDDFFTNSATAFMSRNKFSRLWIFNNLQWYVIKRSDEMWRAITGFKNWLAAKPKWAHYNWWDFVDHLETNQELKAFLNNVLLSTKLAFYLNRADIYDWKDWDNLYRYAIEANDYLSSLPATFFYQLMAAPFKWYWKYKTYQDITWDEWNLADWTSVVLMNTLAQVCSQFFREGKPLMALMDTAVAYWKTWDLWFANTVLGVDLAKIANWIGRMWLIDWLEKYWLEDFSKSSDMIWQILLAGNETTSVGRSLQDTYDVTFVDNVLNDKWYAFISALGNLPVLWELIKETTDKWWFTFNEAKVKELAHMMDNDKQLQNIYQWHINTDIFDWEAINRIYNDYVSFNYPFKSLKSQWKHSVGTITEWKDTTLNSMKEDVFVQNICEKLNMSIEDLHSYITKAGYDAKTVWKLKMVAAAEAAEPGSWKIILSYMAANRLYELEKQVTGKSNPSTADIPEDMMTELKRQVIEEFSEEMFVADRTSQYKVMREYISQANPNIFKSLKNDNKITGYANAIWFTDMLVRQAAQDWDCNAKYFKNIFSVSSKYVKDDAARLALMRHTRAAIDETDLDPSAKMMAKEGSLAWNIEIYNKVKDNKLFRALHPWVLEDFEHRIWWIKDYVNVTGWYRKGYSDGSYNSKYWDSNEQLQNQLMKQIEPYTNPFSSSYVPREWTYAMSTPKWRTNAKDDFSFYLKLYEQLIKDYSDNLVKSEGKKYPAEKIAWMTYKSGGTKDLNKYEHIKPKKLYFPKHKQPEYSTKTISNLPGASG